jgi:hypothetical protein
MKKQFFYFLTIAFLTACAANSSIETRHDTAASIGASAGMTERVLPAGVFNLTSWERVQQPGAAADIYIEGDGLAWVSRYRASMNPTPPDPLALHLAAEDKSRNVIYIARPCQYTGWNGDGACPDLYWTTGTAAPEVIAAYAQALSDIKARDHITGFNIIGYSGGAAIAVLVAAKRSDVLSIRTVAGNTDYAAFTAVHEVSPIKDSIDPVTVAAADSHIPQQHFIGEKDKTVPRDVFDGWKQASGTTACVHATIVPDNTHEKGWAEKWPELLNTPISCSP